ncbi:MAG: DUF5802 family protein [Candidatus Aenigmatarchaeota archaeon]
MTESLLEDFSAGYYMGRFYVEPYDGNPTPVVNEDLHEEMNRQVYATGEGVERLDSPLVMKIENRHLPVEGVYDMPSGTIGVPYNTMKDMDIDNPPELKEVLVAKGDRVEQLRHWI